MAFSEYFRHFSAAHKDLIRAFSPAATDHAAFWLDCADRLAAYASYGLPPPFARSPCNRAAIARHKAIPDLESFPNEKTPKPADLIPYLAKTAQLTINSFTWDATYEAYRYWSPICNLLSLWTGSSPTPIAHYHITSPTCNPPHIAAAFERSALIINALTPAFFMDAPWYVPGSFPHTDPADPSLIRYRPRGKPAHLASMTSAKPGKYLTARYSRDEGTDPLSTTEIANLAAHFRTINARPELQFARTPEEIARVYSRGPSSCMSDGKSNTGEPGLNLVHAYSTPDTAIAYLERNGRPNARTFVHLPTKRYSRIYGDAAALQPALTASGFTPFASGATTGIRLAAIKSKKLRPAHRATEERGEPVLLLPYFDGIQTGYYDRETDSLVLMPNTSPAWPKGATVHYACGGPSINAIPAQAPIPYQTASGGTLYINAVRGSSGRPTQLTDTAHGFGRLDELRAQINPQKPATPPGAPSPPASPPPQRDTTRT